MRKNIINFVCIIMFTLIFWTTSVKANAPEVKRLWGTDRYQTCSKVVDEGWQHSDYAVIVNGENFPDALSASVLAKKYDAPILLTESNNLDSNTIYQLNRLKVKKVFIVGGTGVVSSSVEEQLVRINIQIQRFSGVNRTMTSIDVAHEIGMKNGVILTTDNDFTDALSVASIAAKLQMPIILMPKEGLGDFGDSMVEYEKMPTTYVLGGQDLISDDIVSNFPNVQRIDGKDKYERNINIINTFADKFDFSNTCLAYSEKFADALSGSAYAAINGNPIILMGDYPSEYTKQFLKSKDNAINSLTILGGNAGIKDSEISNIFNGNDQENLQLDHIKSISIYNFELKDKSGEKYTVYIYSDDCEKAKALFKPNDDTAWACVWAGASDGDTLCRGHFKVAYFKNGSNDVNVENLNNFDSDDNIYCFDLNRDFVRTIQNKFTSYPNFILVGQTFNSNDSSINLYCIKDGRLKLVNIYRDNNTFKGFLTSSGKHAFFKQVTEDTFVTSIYYNDDENYGYDINTYRFDKETCSFTFLSKKHISPEEYMNYYYSD